MNDLDPYRPSANLQKEAPPSGLQIPPHAANYLQSLRRGSPVPRLLLAYGLLLILILLPALLKFEMEPFLFVLVLPVLATLIYAVKLIYRLAALMQLDEEEPSMTPLSSTILCCIPCIQVVGIILLAVKIHRHYPRICRQKELDVAPGLSVAPLLIGFFAMLLDKVPHIGLFFTLIFLIAAGIFLFQSHRALKFFAARL
ncbi:MAG: hypothetical protein RL095_1697 [Verrucomicrobiota bacterium]|jgi:hypothetical protein